MPQQSDPEPRFVPQDLWLIGAAVSAWLWTVVRAHHQAIIVDEAWTYNNFVWRLAPAHWEGASNNHLLNSLLMRFFTTAFGVSHLTVRAPALIGGALFIWAAYLLSRLLAAHRLLQITIFVALVINPFVFDYLIVGRGYALAVGFLMAGIAVVAQAQFRAASGLPSSILRACAISSVCFAVSFSANFSFAFIDASALLAVTVWCCLSRHESSRARIVLACAAPASIVIAAVPSWTILHWPPGELYAGATSLARTFGSVAEASVYEVNPHTVNPLLYAALNALKPYLLAVLLAIAALQACLLWAARVRMRNREKAWGLGLGAAVAGAVTLSLSMHWLAFRLFHLLLPQARTAIYLAPAFTLLIAVTATIAAPSRAAVWNRCILVGWLGITSFYFLGCLRLTWFKEWREQADVKQAYFFVVNCAPGQFAQEAIAAPQYWPALVFYRHLYGTDRVAEFSGASAIPPGKNGYVLNYSVDRQFIDAQHLKVIYRGDSSDLVVAVPPPGPSIPHSAECTQYAIRRAAEGYSDRRLSLISVSKGLYDDTDPAILYTGGWFADNQFHDAEGGTSTYSNDTSGSFRLAFHGRRITWGYAKAPNRGQVEVLIDGTKRAVLDLYAPAVEWKVRSSFGDLADGEHLFEVRLLRQRNPASTDRFVDVDFLEVE